MDISYVKYSFQLNFEDTEAHQLLRNFIVTGMKGHIHKNYEYEKNVLDKQMRKMKNMNVLEGKNVGNLIRKEFIKAIKNLKEEDFKSFEYIYIGKLISLSSLIDTYYQSPTQKRRKSMLGVFNSQNNNFSLNGINNGNIKISDAEAMIYQDNFKVKFLLKSLNLAIDDESCLDESNINHINLLNKMKLLKFNRENKFTKKFNKF